MRHSRDLLFMLAAFDVFGLSHIDSANCTPSGFIIAKNALFSMDRKAMKGDYNQGISARISVSKVIRIKLNFSSLKTA